MIFNPDPFIAVHSFFIAKGFSFSCAESCTGGLIAKKITDYSGSSEYFLGSVVAYHNSIKERLLGVRRKTLSRFGAVSAECAVEMAEGVKSKMGSDISLSVTGIAGPEGGSPEKPVGTVFAAFCVGEDIVVRKFFIKGSRKIVRERTANQVMQILLQLIQTEKL